MEQRQSFIDTGMIPDIYADGIVHVENLGSCCRVFFFTYAATEIGGRLERIIVAKLVRPINNLNTGIVSRMLSRTVAPQQPLMIGHH